MIHRVERHIRTVYPFYMAVVLLARMAYSRIPIIGQLLGVVFVATGASIFMKEVFEAWLENGNRLATRSVLSSALLYPVRVFEIARIVSLCLIISISNLGNLLPLPACVRIAGFAIGVGIETVSDVLRKRNARAKVAAQQQTGEQVLAECREQNRSYVLYLRNFEQERLDELMQTGSHSLDTGNSIRSSSNRPVEWALLNSIGKVMPIIGLKRPGDCNALPGIYRYATVPTDWHAEVRAFVREASHIVMWIPTLTKSIRAEIKIIQSEKCLSKTLFVIRHSALPPADLAYIASKATHTINECDSLALLLGEGRQVALHRKMCEYFNLPDRPPFFTMHRPVIYFFVAGIILLFSAWLTYSGIRTMLK